MLLKNAIHLQTLSNGCFDNKLLRRMIFYSEIKLYFRDDIDCMYII